jgi:hypothetical protein
VVNNKLNLKNQINVAFDEAVHPCSICAGMGRKRKDGPCRGHVKGSAGSSTDGSAGEGRKSQSKETRTHLFSTAYIFSVLAAFFRPDASTLYAQTAFNRKAISFDYNLNLLNRLGSRQDTKNTASQKQAVISKNTFIPPKAKKPLTAPLQIIRPSPKTI